MRLIYLAGIGVVVMLSGLACAPQATQPSVDIIGTKAAQLAAVMLTQTAGANSPTPMAPTETLTPIFTETPAPPPTSSEPPKPIRVNTFTGCWKGPGPDYVLVSNIDEKKVVELIGIGNVPGWYIIRNPYFYDACWVEAAHLNIDPRIDLSWLPLMTPQP